ncbi:MAG: rhomboid family intramembrane serine protease [Fimbriimonas sp.]
MAVPYVTHTILALNVILFILDRNFRIFGPAVVFSDLGMRPDDLYPVFHGGFSSIAVTSLFTSLWLHVNLTHIIGNMVFLMVFGGSIEITVGPWRFALFYLLWGFAASLTHFLMDMHSPIPVLGASGAIGGILGAYFLLYPANKIDLVIPLLAFKTFEIPAWMLLGSWFILQIAVPQEGVANWAHVGGFLAGMVTVLLMGGRQVVLKRTTGINYDF